MSEENVPDLYRLAFIPGVFRCPQCDFRLSKQTLDASTGNVGTTPENRQSEPCPNDGNWMIAVTYREEIVDWEKAFTAKAAELAATRVDLEGAHKEIERLKNKYIKTFESAKKWATRAGIAERERDEAREALLIAKRAIYLAAVNAHAGYPPDGIEAVYLKTAKEELITEGNANP